MGKWEMENWKIGKMEKWAESSGGVEIFIEKETPPNFLQR